MNPNHIGTNFDDFLNEEGIMTDKQIENLYKIKDLCCEETKYCGMSCYHCGNECNEHKILILINEVLNDR